MALKHDEPPPYDYEPGLIIPSVPSAKRQSIFGKLVSSITPSNNSRNKKLSKGRFEEDDLELLSQYDTVILMDDSGSMNHPGSIRGKSRWAEACEALATLAEIAAKYDTDGIDIHFLNNRQAGVFNVTSADEVEKAFMRVRPTKSTPTGDRLDQLLKTYLKKLDAADIQADGTPCDKHGEPIKRINIIVITDGRATDDPKPPIIDAARRLNRLDVCSVQLGIQFVQIGNDKKATQALKELDDDLHRQNDIRDIVDTTPYSKLNPVTAAGLIKILLGGINRRVDEQRLK